MIVKNHKCIQFMIYEVKKQVKRRLSTMHKIKQTPSWLFPHAKCKKYFSILTFCIDTQFFVNNVSISTWSLIGQHMFICQWHDMTSWNNLYKDEFQPKNNDYMM